MFGGFVLRDGREGIVGDVGTDNVEDELAEVAFEDGFEVGEGHGDEGGETLGQGLAGEGAVCLVHLEEERVDAVFVAREEGGEEDLGFGEKVDEGGNGCAPN